MRTRKRVETATSGEPTDTEKQPRAREDAVMSDTPYLEIDQLAEINQSAGEVEVTYGEELFTPAPYHSFRVGPFWAKGFTRVGESRTQAIARLYAELEAAASAQREQRYQQYKAAVRQMYGDKAADSMFGTKR